jgi:anti-sigma regulatory factor (Ser/Thr protein kinase)
MSKACAPATLLLPMRRDHEPLQSGKAMASGSTRWLPATWPLMSHLELAALPTAVSCARRHAKAVVQEWGLAAIAENTELVVSELVTNAVRASDYLHSGGLTTPVVRLWLASDLRSVLVRVWDSNSQMPARRDAGPDDDGGRGLMLVEYLANEWGAYRKADGKVVWVLL